jgi:hypothetical protein
MSAGICFHLDENKYCIYRKNLEYSLLIIILINEILRNFDELKCVFAFSVFYLKKFTALKHIFRIFTDVLPHFFLLYAANTLIERGSV